MKATPHRQRVAKTRSRLKRIRSLLRLAQFIQVPIRRPGVGKKTVRKVGTDEWKLGEERSRSEDLQRIWTVWDELEFSNLATGGKDHILKHMYTQTEILELTGSDHNLLPPRPPTQGRTSQRLRRVGQFRPRTTTRTPLPSSSESFLFLSTSFLLCCFSLSSSVAFCSLLS